MARIILFLLQDRAIIPSGSNLCPLTFTQGEKPLEYLADCFCRSRELNPSRLNRKLAVGLTKPTKMKLTKHLLDMVSTAVGTMVIHSCLVNSQAAAVQTYPGLPPVAELIPEVKTCLVNMVRTCLMIVERLL